MNKFSKISKTLTVVAVVLFVVSVSSTFVFNGRLPEETIWQIFKVSGIGFLASSTLAILARVEWRF